MFQIGQAIDIHRLKKTKEIINQKLGGFSVPTNWKVIAHSDGDLVLHAIANAVLGSTQNLDIGHYFSDNDSNNKNIDSTHIINYALNELKKTKYELVNIDMTIVCENIMLSHFKQDIIKSIQTITKCQKVNVKATRFEHKSKFIECHVSLLVQKKGK